MMIITRRVGESVAIGIQNAADAIEVKVLDIQSEEVLIGVNLPPEMTVYPEEVWRQLKDNQRDA